MRVKGKYRRGTLQAMFASRWVEDTETGCHVWSGLLSPSGYGRFKFRGQGFRAHRLAWMLHHGPIPPGMCVCHKCDVRTCVNVDHLFLGTSADNTADRDTKGRQARGERSGTAKLTEDNVRAIRSMHGGGATCVEIGRQFGVSDVLVSYIVRRKNWRHV